MRKCSVNEERHKQLPLGEHGLLELSNIPKNNKRKHGRFETPIEEKPNSMMNDKNANSQVPQTYFFLIPKQKLYTLCPVSLRVQLSNKLVTALPGNSLIDSDAKGYKRAR